MSYRGKLLEGGESCWAARKASTTHPPPSHTKRRCVVCVCVSGVGWEGRVLAMWAFSDHSLFLQGSFRTDAFACGQC